MEKTTGSHCISHSLTRGDLDLLLFEHGKCIEYLAMLHHGHGYVRHEVRVSPKCEDTIFDVSHLSTPRFCNFL